MQNKASLSDYVVSLVYVVTFSWPQYFGICQLPTLQLKAVLMQLVMSTQLLQLPFWWCTITYTPQLYLQHDKKCTYNTTKSAPTTRQKVQKTDWPAISGGSSEETWNAFHARRQIFKQGTALAPAKITQQLFRCCDESLCNDILQGSDSDTATTTEVTLLALITDLLLFL